MFNTKRIELLEERLRMAKQTITELNNTVSDLVVSVLKLEHPPKFTIGETVYAIVDNEFVHGTVRSVEYWGGAEIWHYEILCNGRLKVYANEKEICKEIPKIKA